MKQTYCVKASIPCKIEGERNITKYFDVRDLNRDELHVYVTDLRKKGFTVRTSLYESKLTNLDWASGGPIEEDT